jgi:hypothetical protein
MEEIEGNTCCDSQSRHKIVNDGPHNGLGLNWSGKPAINAEKRYSNENNDVQPIEMLMPI